MSIQVVYFLGLGLALGLKIAYCVYMRPDSQGVWRAIGDFFFEDTNSAFTTLITIAVSWLLVAVYVGDITGFAEYVSTLPQHKAVAFVLGIAMESAAPKIFSGIVNRVAGSA